MMLLLNGDLALSLLSYELQVLNTSGVLVFVTFIPPKLREQHLMRCCHPEAKFYSLIRIGLLILAGLCLSLCQDSTLMLLHTHYNQSCQNDENIDPESPT